MELPESARFDKRIPKTKFYQHLDISPAVKRCFVEQLDSVLAQDYPNVSVFVRDDGCGLGDADPKLLFDRFYRGDPSRNRGTGGTGLGLAIVKSVVDAHDGTVEAFNLPDGGACFLVAIPSIT